MPMKKLLTHKKEWIREIAQSCFSIPQIKDTQIMFRPGHADFTFREFLMVTVRARYFFFFKRSQEYLIYYNDRPYKRFLIANADFPYTHGIEESTKEIAKFFSKL